MNENTNNDDDDDDMADLFSFGTTTTTTGTTTTNDVISSITTRTTTPTIIHDDHNNNNHNNNSSTMSNTNTTCTDDMNKTVLFGTLPAFLSQRTNNIKKDRDIDNGNTTTTIDPFLELLQTESSNSSNSNTIMFSKDGDRTSTNNYHSSSTDPELLDNATKDILHWLETESNTKNGTKSIISFELPVVPVPSSVEPVVVVQQQPTVVSLPPIYTTLQDALMSKDATQQQIRDLFYKEQANCDEPIVVTLQQQQQQNKSDSSKDVVVVKIQFRAELYCRMICHNRTIDTIMNGSLADSFHQWKKTSIIQQEQQQVNLDNTEQQQQQYIQWIRQQNIAQRIVSAISSLSSSTTTTSTSRTIEECEQDLIDLVLYHYQSTFSTTTSNNTTTRHSTGTTVDIVDSNNANNNNGTNAQSMETSNSTTNNNNSNNNNNNGSTVQNDILLPMVASTLLAANIPVAVAAVVLSQIIPNFIPLLGLPPATERWEAALFLHSEFYLLACYHIPLLVIHLDKYIPGWYWPKLPERTTSSSSSSSDLHDDTNDKENVNGETAVQIGRNLKKQGQVPLSWLLSHLSGECDGTALPIELVLSLWDRILTGQQNNSATRFFLTLSVLERQAATLLLLTGDDLFHALQNVWTLETIDENKEPNEKEWKYEWWPQALELQLSTPVSVLDRLQVVEDEAFQHAIKRKQERAEAMLRERLEAEAAAYKEAQELKAEEARVRLSRARLVAFYRKHAPDKESNIDQIMETYNGRLDILDSKLKSKYGEGFNPAVKAKPPPPPKTNLISKMQQRLKREKSGIDEDVLDSAMEERKPVQVSVFVSAEEVLPVICWSKEATAARGLDQSRRRQMNRKKRNALKFYLIDCRTEEAVQEQGRFPTAFRLSPETLQDPEKLQEHEDTLESFRGAVHIVIMGEGFNAIPNLYNQKLSPKLQELMEQDEARTNLCALFFQKRGFCFVSLLTGGFCAAHSWLVRDGPQHHLNVSSVLVDYNPEMTLFGQLETLHNASMTEKAQRKMANLLEASMVTVTKRAIQLERLTAELNDNKDGQRQGFRKLFGRADTSNSNTADGVENQGPNNYNSDKSNTVVEKSTISTFQNPFAGMVKRDEKTDVGHGLPTSSESNSSHLSSLQDALAVPASDSSSNPESVLETTSVHPPPPPTGSTSTSSSPVVVSASATHKLGKFFQQTSEVVGVATTAAVVAATTAATSTKMGMTSTATGTETNNNNNKVKEDTAINNRFKGFGAALQQTRARFGTTTLTPPASSSVVTGLASVSPTATATTTTTTTTTATTTSETTTSTTATSVGGFNFNSFRKSAMSRVLNQSQQAATNPNDAEAEVKFV